MTADRERIRRGGASRTIVGAVVAIVLAALLAWGFVQGRSEAAREAAQERSIAAPQRVSLVKGEPVVTLDLAAQRADGIETVALTNIPYRERLRAYGTVLDLGPLTRLANAYADGAARLQITEAKLVAARTAYDRARKLYNDRQNMSAAQLQAAEAAFRIGEAGHAAAQAQLRMLAATAQQSWGPVLGEAIVGGGALLQRLMSRQEVLVQITLRPGQTVRQPPAGASVQLADGSHAPLRFVSAATKTDPRVQGMSFFFTAPAQDGLLPGMNIVAFLPADRTIRGALVPASAIVWEKGRAWAYFRAGPETFARRAVATGLPAPKGGYVVQGISDGTGVVVRGAQMLLSEEFRAQIHTGDED